MYYHHLFLAQDINNMGTLFNPKKDAPKESVDSATKKTESEKSVHRPGEMAALIILYFVALGIGLVGLCGGFME